MPPVYLTSTYVQAGPGDHKGYEYSRTQNPTRKPLEDQVAALENGKHGFCFGSGMAAIDTLIKTLNPGDEVISTSDLYGGTYRLFTKVYAKFGIKFHFVSMADPSVVERLVNENTKIIWVETPTNPMMNIIDIAAMSAVAKRNNVLLAVDNTFATPYLQRPIDLGADIVMHSITKYMGGHSDVVMGCLVVNDDALANEIGFLQNSCGPVPGPMDCFLVLRGIKTLHVRMQRHSENGAAIANWLTRHAKVENVYWPGLPNHPNHEVAKRQMNDFGGMISFTLKGDKIADATKVLETVRLFALAESLGGVESLIGHPATMTHASIPREDRLNVGLLDSLIRLSVGIEDVEDLVADLSNALDTI